METVSEILIWVALQVLLRVLSFNWIVLGLRFLCRRSHGIINYRIGVPYLHTRILTGVHAKATYWRDSKRGLSHTCFQVDAKLAAEAEARNAAQMQAPGESHIQF